MKYLFLLAFFVCFQSILFSQTTHYLNDIDFSRVHYYKIASGYVEPSPENGVVLTPKQTTTLLSILDSRETHTGSRMRCFSPHDEFIFYNSNDEEVGHIIVAFECNAMLAEPAIPAMQAFKNPGISKNGEARLKNLVGEISKSLPVQKALPSEIISHVVKKGEDLQSIAKRYRTSATSIQDLNPVALTKSNLVNQELKIQKNSHSLNYAPLRSINVVKTKDVLMSEEPSRAVPVAEMRIKKTTVDEPVTRNISNKAEAPKPAPMKPTPVVIYVVKKGDTLYSIARQNQTTVERLQKINQLKNVSLAVGQKLKV